MFTPVGVLCFLRETCVRLFFLSPPWLPWRPFPHWLINPKRHSTKVTRRWTARSRFLSRQPKHALKRHWEFRDRVEPGMGTLEHGSSPHPCRRTGAQSLCENCSAPSSFNNPANRTCLAGLSFCQPIADWSNSLLLADPRPSQRFLASHRNKHGQSQVARSWAWLSSQRSG